MSVRRNSFLSLVFLTLTFLSTLSIAQEQANTTPAKYDLVWADEFNYHGRPDRTKWGYEYGFFRNKELQYYTDRRKNARVRNGHLILQARREWIRNESYNPQAARTAEPEERWKFQRKFARYTSASLSTMNLAQWQYGKIEVRAKLPKGVGLWAAIWMLGENSNEVDWPQSGEIDIMEYVGFDKNTIYGTVHTGAYNSENANGDKAFIQRPNDRFHVFAIEWSPDTIVFLSDGVPYHRFDNDYKTADEWPFDQPFHLKLNVAVGGAWGEIHGVNNKVFPQKMVVDYVRVYQAR